MMPGRQYLDVRTTLTLDDDIAAKLREQVRKSGKPFKEVVNEALRTGLNTTEPAKARKRFVVRAKPAGLRPGLSYDNIEELLDQIDGPLRR